MIRRGFLAGALVIATIALAAPAAAEVSDACDTTHVTADVPATVERNLDALADSHASAGPSVPQDTPASVERNVRALYQESGCA